GSSPGLAAEHRGHALPFIGVDRARGADRPPARNPGGGDVLAHLAHVVHVGRVAPQRDRAYQPLAPVDVQPHAQQPAGARLDDRLEPEVQPPEQQHVSPGAAGEQSDHHRTALPGAFRQRCGAHAGVTARTPRRRAYPTSAYPTSAASARAAPSSPAWTCAASWWGWLGRWDRAVAS